VSIIHNERAILREAYKHLDEALEYLNAELNKEEQAHSNSIYRNYQDGNQDMQVIADSLDRPPNNAIQRLPSLKYKITTLLAGIYELTDATSQLQHLTEECIELTRQAQIDYNTHIIEGEGDVRTDPYDRNRTQKRQSIRARPGSLESRDQAPGPPLDDLEPGDLQQSQDHARPQPNGRASPGKGA
jgi:hypothetical protein